MGKRRRPSLLHLLERNGMNLCVMVVMGKHFPDLLRLFKVEEAVALKRFEEFSLI